MKKRTGVERAVIVMAVVVVLLAIALIVVNVADIRIRRRYLHVFTDSTEFFKRRFFITERVTVFYHFFENRSLA